MQANDARRARHVLLLARHFPPSSEIGARRAARLARALVALGHDVTVVTVAERFERRLDPSDAASLGRATLTRTGTLSPTGWRNAFRSIATAGTTVRSPRGPGVAVEPGRLRRRAALAVEWLLVNGLPVDGDLLWVPFAVRAALRAHRVQPIDVVMATLPPWSALLAAARIRRRVDARLVVDYRDPWWTMRRVRRPRARRRNALEDRLERRLLASADLVLFASPSALALYRDEVLGSSGPRLECLPNAIDRFVEGDPVRPTDTVVWAHAGLLYGGRSLAPVLRAMARSAPRVPSRLELIGDAPVEDLALAEALGVRDRVEWLGPMPLARCLARLRRAHRLVAVVSADHRASVPAKLFDYFSVRRPVLLLGDPSHDAAAIVACSRANRSIAADDAAGLDRLLQEDAVDLPRGGPPDVERAAYEELLAEAQTQRLGAWLGALPPGHGARR